MNKKLKLHMVGKLQSNKAKRQLKFLISYILWIAELADILSSPKKKLINLKIFHSSQYGNEIQKSGIPANELMLFIITAQKKKI